MLRASIFPAGMGFHKSNYSYHHGTNGIAISLMYAANKSKRTPCNKTTVKHDNNENSHHGPSL